MWDDFVPIFASYSFASILCFSVLSGFCNNCKHIVQIFILRKVLHFSLCNGNIHVVMWLEKFLPLFCFIKSGISNLYRESAEGLLRHNGRTFSAVWNIPSWNCPKFGVDLELTPFFRRVRNFVHNLFGWLCRRNVKMEIVYGMWPNLDHILT